MFNCVRKEDIDYSPYDEGEWRFSFFSSIDSLISKFDIRIAFAHLSEIKFELRFESQFSLSCLASWYRLKLWLFIAYVVAFVSLAASVGLLIQDSVVKTGPSTWTGVAGVFQCVFVLIRYYPFYTCYSFRVLLFR